MTQQPNAAGRALGDCFKAQLARDHAETLRNEGSYFAAVALELLQVYYGQLEGLEEQLTSACRDAHVGTGCTLIVTKDQWGPASLAVHAAWFSHMKQLGRQSWVLHGFTPVMTLDVLSVLFGPMEAVYREYLASTPDTPACA